MRIKKNRGSKAGGSFFAHRGNSLSVRPGTQQIYFPITGIRRRIAAARVHVIKQNIEKSGIPTILGSSMLCMPLAVRISMSPICSAYTPRVSRESSRITFFAPGPKECLLTLAVEKRKSAVEIINVKIPKLS